MLQIPFLSPHIYLSDISYYLKNPVSTEQFRHALQERWQQNNILITKSGRQSIWIVLSSLDPATDSEVIVSSFMCPVVPIAVIKAGSKPVFCDVVPDGFVMSIEDVERKITSKTIAIIMPYSFGCYSDIGRFKELADKHDLILIEDCCQTLDGKHNGKRVGFNADFGVWSFGISKNIGSLNGGAIWFNEKHKERMEAHMKKLGETIKEHHDPLELVLAAGMPFINKRFGYTVTHKLLELIDQKREIKRSAEINTVEFDSKMTSLDATLCFLQLQRYEAVYNKRMANFFIYKNKLKDFMRFPEDVPGFEPDLLYVPVLLKKDLRDKLLRKFSFVNDINFSHLEKFKIFKQFPFDTVNREKVRDEYLLLSIHSENSETEFMADQLKKYLMNA